MHLIPPFQSLSADHHRGLAQQHELQQGEFLKRIVTRQVQGIFLHPVRKKVDPSSRLTMRDLMRSCVPPNADAPLFLSVDQRAAAENPSVTFLESDSAAVDAFVAGCMIALFHSSPEECRTEPIKASHFRKFFAKDATEAFQSQTWNDETSTFSTHQDEMLEDLGAEPLFDLSLLCQAVGSLSIDQFVECSLGDDASMISTSVRTHNTTASVATTQAGSHVDQGDPIDVDDESMATSENSDDDTNPAALNAAAPTSSIPSQGPPNQDDTANQTAGPSSGEVTGRPPQWRRRRAGPVNPPGAPGGPVTVLPSRLGTFPNKCCPTCFEWVF
jgi:hypothetical protein